MNSEIFENSNPKNLYPKIVASLSLLLFLFDIVVCIDFFIPRTHVKCEVKDKSLEVANHVRYNRPYYSIQLNNDWIRTDERTYKSLYTGDTLSVEKTKVFRKISSIEDPNQKFKQLKVYVAPFSYFPLFPVIFMLPLIFLFFKGKSILLMTIRPLSMGIALISLLMTFF